MKRKIQKIKDSFQITIPKEFADDLKLKEGEKLDFSIEGRKIIMTPVAHILQEKEPQTAARTDVNAISGLSPDMKNVSITA